jgi:hypothetical protein
VAPEAPLERNDAGLYPAGEGWFVLNARDARWFESDGMGVYTPFTRPTAKLYDEAAAELEQAREHASHARPEG